MRPSTNDILNAYERMAEAWEQSVAPPSLEVFTEAVKRANLERWCSAVSVANSILAGRWPPDAR